MDNRLPLPPTIGARITSGIEDQNNRVGRCWHNWRDDLGMKYMYITHTFGSRVDVDRKSQAPVDLKLGQLTRPRGKKLKNHDVNVANGIVSYMEKALKNNLEGFEDQEKASKLL
ncbi:hypothetical protein M9H77_23819 [Catharanthus roseus]|uniref:Uncharacterized protein n=1 Tax=Catharanthus roseus TaxID=4058 RepID=A0ACC0AUT4_CATRO|nr:hypothetical protein M9H77_23819 [Catharanthus roseus]